jgi:hypothetical protein
MMDPTGMMSLHQDTRFFVVPHVDGCLVYVQFMGLELVYGWLGARKLGYGWKKWMILMICVHPLVGLRTTWV